MRSTGDCPVASSSSGATGTPDSSDSQPGGASDDSERRPCGRPRNANQLATELNLDYRTVRHHLGVLREAGLVRRSGDGYGDGYLPSDRVLEYWDTVGDIDDRPIR